MNFFSFFGIFHLFLQVRPDLGDLLERQPNLNAFLGAEQTDSSQKVSSAQNCEQSLPRILDVVRRFEFLLEVAVYRRAEASSNSFPPAA